MSRLGEVASVSRKVIKYGSIGILVMVVGRMLWGVGYTWWKTRNPDPPPPPDAKFGTLPKLEFPAIVEQPSLQYTLETRTGGLPVLEDQFAVYFMPIKRPSLLAYDQSAALADRLDFIQEPEKLSKKEYRWNSSSPVSSSFTIDIITGEFVLNRIWQEDEGFLTPTLFFSEERAVDVSRNFLSRIGLLPEDIRLGTHSIQTLRNQDGELVTAASISQAQFIRVNLFRAPVSGVIVVNPFVDRGLISLVLAFQKEEARQFINVEYSYFPVEIEQFATYPLIGVAQAWQRLQDGEAFVSSFPNGVDNIVLRDVYLAYYDSDTPQQFLQPVYVFEGDDNYFAYVPAVADEWVQ